MPIVELELKHLLPLKSWIKSKIESNTGQLIQKFNDDSISESEEIDEGIYLIDNNPLAWCAHTYYLPDGRRSIVQTPNPVLVYAEQHTQALQEAGIVDFTVEETTDKTPIGVDVDRLINSVKIESWAKRSKG